MRVSHCSCLLNKRLPRRPYHRHAQRMQSVIIIHLHNRGRRQHRVIRPYARRVFGGLFDGLHLLLAAGVVEGADDDGLAEEDVAR